MQLKMNTNEETQKKMYTLFGTVQKNNFAIGVKELLAFSSHIFQKCST